PSQSVPTNSRAGPPYITLVVPDGRCISHRCFWKQQQNGSIALTHGWPEFYRMYQINLDSILLFKHKGNSEFQPNVPHLSHFTGQRHTLFLSHGHIEVEATYTRFSGRRDSCFGIIFGGWAEFASLCKFEPGGVGIFEVISTELVTILQ
ncbi:hypothetical protein S83_019595, partial [Arachis hypogaea]